MKDEEKIQILIKNGWHHYYSDAWVHENIKQMLERRGKLFYCPSYEGFQLSTDEAYEFQTKYNT